MESKITIEDLRTGWPEWDFWPPTTSRRAPRDARGWLAYRREPLPAGSHRDPALTIALVKDTLPALNEALTEQARILSALTGG